MRHDAYGLPVSTEALEALEACFRAGDMDRAERLLAERIARRPDHFWKSRTAMGIRTAAR